MTDRGTGEEHMWSVRVGSAKGHRTAVVRTGGGDQFEGSLADRTDGEGLGGSVVKASCLNIPSEHVTHDPPAC